MDWMKLALQVVKHHTHAHDAKCRTHRYIYIAPFTGIPNGFPNSTFLQHEIRLLTELLNITALTLYCFHTKVFKVNVRLRQMRSLYGLAPFAFPTNIYARRVEHILSNIALIFETWVRIIVREFPLLFFTMRQTFQLTLCILGSKRV